MKSWVDIHFGDFKVDENELKSMFELLFYWF
jgi:hypothetical protein